MTETRYWLAFNLARGIGPVKTRALLDHFGDLQTAWQASAHELEQVGLDKRAINNLLDARKTLDLDKALKKLEQSGVRLITWDDDAYPIRLKEIDDPPPVLYVRGELKATDEFAVAIVGTRQATTYGKEVARQLATGLAHNQVTVVSGLARGIDLSAHEAALVAGGRTIAVLGCGVDIIYPSEGRRINAQLVTNGALISDLPLGTTPEPANFPPRNRLISGLSLGVIVVEAGDKSGALITADFALEQGREVFAVPGNIYSKGSRGTNRLIQTGAKLITCVEEVLDELNLKLVTQQAQVREEIPADDTEHVVLSALTHEPLHIDELSRMLTMPIPTLSATLTVMELKGMARHVGGMSYIRCQ